MSQEAALHFEKTALILNQKPLLKLFYQEVYETLRAKIEVGPKEGKVLELGSGGGFFKDYIPDLIASDMALGPSIDQVVDARSLPFTDRSLRAICMMNVFHHIPDVEKFFKEAERCLVPGGQILLFDQHVGILSRYILRYLHSEPFDSKKSEWSFDSSGPMSGANGALTWMVFKRDRKIFEKKFPSLKIQEYRACYPLSYWINGGLKDDWSLVGAGKFSTSLLGALDRIMLKISPDFGSFVYVSVVNT